MQADEPVAAIRTATRHPERTMSPRELDNWLPMSRLTWLAGAMVLGVMMLASYGIYRTLLTSEIKDIERHLQNIARAAESDLISNTIKQIQAQERMAGRLTRIDRDIWLADALSFQEHYPFYRALLVLEPDLSVRWQSSVREVGQPFSGRSDYLAELNNAADSGELVITGAFWLPDGVAGVSFHTPVGRGNRHSGYLTAVMSVPEAIDGLISPFIREDVWINVEVDGTLVYPVGGGISPTPTGWTESFFLELDDDTSGFDFSVTLRPKTVEQLRSRLPETALIGGMLLSFLLTVACVLALSTATQARVMRQANAKLQAEVRDRELAEQELEYLATHDPLTGLPNRTGISRHLEEQLQDGVAADTVLAVLFVDLDQFKDINDSLGHQFGDQLLKQIPGRLSAILHPRDFLGRHGGDEFVITVQRNNRADIETLAERILEGLDKGFPIEGSRFFITASIGIAAYPESGQSATELIQNADSALFQAKKAGRNQYALFTGELLEQVQHRLNLGRDIRHALENAQFHMVYQPIISMDDLSLCGLEALMRWQHPDGRDISPTEFISIAEETGTIHRLSQFALEHALEDLTRLRSGRKSPIPWVAVNISGSQFRQAGFAEQLSLALHRHRLPPDSLHLEITEQVLMENLFRNRMALEQLDDIGVKIVVDDFGVGYSSLAYLKNFPVTTVKIDKGFIRHLTEDKDDQAITHTICNLAHNLGMYTIAEGIESEAQLHLLRQYGCSMGQGFMFSRPLPITAITEMLDTGPAWKTSGRARS